MVWKYIVTGFLLVGFVLYYPAIKETLNLPFSYQTIILTGSLLLIFVVTPLYWRSIYKQGKKEKENNTEIGQHRE